MTNSIPSYRLKIERAKRHIREITEEIRTWLADEPYSVFTEDDYEVGKRLWKVRVNRCVPAEWSGIVGDAIHNARAALDLLMVAVVRHCDPNRASYNHVKFIVSESKESFEARLPKVMKGASREARRLVENLKPYKGGDEAFWRLHQLDILDKHKAIIPVGAGHRSIHLRHSPSRMFRDSGIKGIENLDDFVLTLRQDEIDFPIEDGAEVFSRWLNEEAPFEDDVQFTFEIAFGEGQILKGEPVVPALTQICQFVEGTFDIFERHILNSNC